MYGELQQGNNRVSWQTAILIHSGVQSFETGRTERIRQAQLRRKWPDQAVMQQDSHVMCVNGPVRAERVWWPLEEYMHRR